MSRIQLWIKGLSYSQTQTGAYALILGEQEGNRTLPIIIGAFEAQSIAIALEKEINPPRPLTHDLFTTVMQNYGLGIKEVIIHKLEEGVFHASLVCSSEEGKEMAIDARTSDAVALATRFSAPIFTYEQILEKAGVVLEEDEETSDDVPDSSDPLESDEPSDIASLESLHSQLEDAVKNEDYERAARLRDEISKREKN
jgi:hypothetical protein